MSNQTHLLKSKRFLPLFITQFFGAFNDNAFKNAFLIWFTYDVAIENGLDAPMMVTIAAGLFILPFFLFSATAGQLADKFERSKLTQIIKTIEIFLMATCAICFLAMNIYGLLFILFLMGAQSTFFGPIKYSLLPDHLKDEELVAGNSLIEAGTFLSILLGTIFGGLIIRMENGIEFLSFFVICFAIIGQLASRKIPKATISDANLKIGWNIFTQTWKIIGFARIEKSVWFSILGIAWFWLIGATFLTQFPTFTKEVIKGDEHIVTFFLTLFSLGIGIGSFLCNKLLKGKINGKLTPYGSIGITISILLFTIASYKFEIDRMLYWEQVLNYEDKILTLSEFISVGISSWILALSLLVLSVSLGLYVVPLYSIMQHRSNPKHLSRIIASNNVINSLFMLIASLVVLVLFWLNFTVINILLMLGILNFFVFLVVVRIVKRGL